MIFKRTLALNVIALCVALVIQFPSTNAALAATCHFPAPNPVTMTLQRNEGFVQENNSRTRETLMKMQRNSGQRTAFGSDWVPVGLTVTELKYNMRIKIEAFKLPNGGVCGRLSSVDADIGYQKINVYIARRFRPGSCAYQSILDHEYTHVAVFRQALEDYAPRIERRLTRATNSLKPIHARTPAQAAKYLRGQLSAATKPLYEEMRRTLKRNNARLDTPERYRSEQSRCSDW